MSLVDVQHVYCTVFIQALVYTIRTAQARSVAHIISMTNLGVKAISRQNKDVVRQPLLKFLFVELCDQIAHAYQRVDEQTAMALPGFVSSGFSSRWLNGTARSSVTAVRPANQCSVLRMGLQVKTEPLPRSQIGLEISVGKEECMAAWNSIIKELQKNATVNGFRKGNVPRQIIVNRFGEERIRASACEEVIEKSIQKALADAGINAIGQAEFNTEGGVETVIRNYSPKSELTFKVKVDVWPECSFTAPYMELEVEAEEPLFDESLIDNALDQMRKKESFSVLSPAGTSADIGNWLSSIWSASIETRTEVRGTVFRKLPMEMQSKVTLETGKYMAGFVERYCWHGSRRRRAASPWSFLKAKCRPELAGCEKRSLDVNASTQVKGYSFAGAGR